MCEGGGVGVEGRGGCGGEGWVWRGGVGVEGRGGCEGGGVGVKGEEWV